MFTRIRNGWQLVGAMLALVALYLVLARSTGAVKLGNSLFSGTNRTLRTLQGR